MKRQAGTTLLEALVSLLVLALGLLALARLQVGNLVESRQTNTRAIAIQLAADLQERMLNNIAALKLDPAKNPYIVPFGPVEAPDGCGNKACSPQHRAANDVMAWKAQLASQLPNGDAQVFASPDNPGQVGVLISWSELQSQHAAAAVAAKDDATIAEYRQANAVWTSPVFEGSGVTSVTCPDRQTCHLFYLRP